MNKLGDWRNHFAAPAREERVWPLGLFTGLCGEK
jgi:hypothetical protein